MKHNITCTICCIIEDAPHRTAKVSSISSFLTNAVLWHRSPNAHHPLGKLKQNMKAQPSCPVSAAGPGPPEQKPDSAHPSPLSLSLNHAYACNIIVTGGLTELLWLHALCIFNWWWLLVASLSFIMHVIWSIFFPCNLLLTIIVPSDNPKNSEESRGSAYLRYHCVSYDWVPCLVSRVITVHLTMPHAPPFLPS